MADFLLELLSEEIPARMQDKARADLARLFEAELGKAGLKAEALETYATPRRLALIARGLPPETAAVREETKGPRASAPPQALEGFLRKTGLTREQLEERDGILFAIVEKPGRATAAVLAEAVPAIVRAFPWPKSMRWGAASASTESLRWVRPLQGIVALFGEAIVPFEIAGVKSGAATVGHRFHHPGAITIGSANDYVEKLQACHALVDQEERKRLIREGAAAAAEGAGLALVEDEGLVAENAGLTEWPVPLLGRFDPAFLDVPPEVIQLTMRTNQKYFALTVPPHPQDGEGDHPKGGGGVLAPNFLCTANILASDGGAAIVQGNERVLSARLSDAKFFWEQDLKIPLEEQAKKLSQIVFHEKLGTVADKVERVAKLARWLVEEGIVKSSPSLLGEGDHAQHGGGAPPPSARAAGPPPRDKLGEDREQLAHLAERAARLSKADLVTQMVGEFPELQGIIGGHLARAQGEPDEVADAIRDHYKPVGQGDEVPTAPVTVAVSLADKLDTIASFFGVGVTPTGSKDPFALRRAALGVIQLLIVNQLRVSLEAAIYKAEETVGFQRVNARVQAYAKAAKEARRALGLQYADKTIQEEHAGRREFRDAFNEFFLNESGLLDFFADRLKVQQREAGVRHDLIDAVFALGGEDDLVRLLARVRALQAFVETPEGADLLAGYKRAANILRKENWEGSGTEQKQLSYTPEDEEQKLIAALDSAEPKARAAVEAEDFEGAMGALASLRGPVDAFFDKVTVNDPDPAKREARLALLARMRDAVHLVADFSRIEG
ncbi:MAG TPA: glycine--tRNA ligase subunit beta [Allosphingosinicella sp.]|jgi:glycyl-tRNA synthetase beta chain